MISKEAPVLDTAEATKSESVVRAELWRNEMAAALRSLQVQPERTVTIEGVTYFSRIPTGENRIMLTKYETNSTEASGFWYTLPRVADTLLYVQVMDDRVIIMRDDVKRRKTEAPHLIGQRPEYQTTYYGSLRSLPIIQGRIAKGLKHIHEPFVLELDDPEDTVAVEQMQGDDAEYVQVMRELKEILAVLTPDIIKSTNVW